MNAEVPEARPSGTMAAEPVEAPVAEAAPAPASLGERVRGWAGNRRARFAAGALLTVLLGFVPATVVASVREHAAFAEVDGHLRERQADVRTMEDWNALDQIRSAAHDEKVADKHSIAVGSLMIWAAVSAAFGFVWFRKIDWDRFAAG